MNYHIQVIEGGYVLTYPTKAGSITCYCATWEDVLTKLKDYPPPR
jgi:hypothetical protein